MADPIQFKPKDDYSEHIILKEVDGETIRLVNIDAMTEDQFKKYCRDTGSEYFVRFSVNVG